MSISMSFGRSYDNHNDNWMFVRDRDIEQSNIQRYYVNHSEQDRIGRNSTVINNTFVDNQRRTTYVSGPTRVQVQKVVGRTITPVVIRGVNKPGQEISNGQLRIYRPQVVKNTPNGRQSVPVRVTKMNDIRRTKSTNSTNQNQQGTPVNRTITQPVRTLTPQNNNSQPIQRREVNQQDNKQIPQNRISSPSNSNGNSQPVFSPTTKPVDINRPIRRPDAVTPQNKIQQPVQQRTVTPQNKIQQPVPQRTVTPQNNNQQPVPQRTVTPPNNSPRQDQQRNASPQNNNPQQAQPVKPAIPDNNNGRRSEANTDNKTKANQTQNVQPANDRPVKQQKSIKQQVRKEQAKTPDAVTNQK